MLVPLNTPPIYSFDALYNYISALSRVTIPRYDFSGTSIWTDIVCTISVRYCDIGKLD